VAPSFIWVRLSAASKEDPFQGGEFREVKSMKKQAITFRWALLACVAAILSGALMTACAATSTTESTGGYIDDAAITAKVKAALVSDSHLRSPVQTPLQIRVETYKGVVQLSGFVNSREAAERAALDASGVPGVKQVVNDLVVKTNVSWTPGKSESA
jgi:hyperosmotically inducible periplasmic protein